MVAKLVPEKGSMLDVGALSALLLEPLAQARAGQDLPLADLTDRFVRATETPFIQAKEDQHKEASSEKHPS